MHVDFCLPALAVIGLIFCRPRKGILRRQQPKEIGSNRSLRGSANPQNGIALGQSHYSIQPEDTVSNFGVSRFYSTKAIVVSALVAAFTLITAMVTLSGYLITCNELHYEVRRQVLGRTTLGKATIFVSALRIKHVSCVWERVYCSQY